MRRLDRHCRALQSDLFRPIRPTPDWRRLLADVRRKATEPMARMLRERWHRGAADTEIEHICRRAL
jgi:hypothetical protein